MITRHEGRLNAEGLRFALIVSRFNELFTGKLEQGALDALVRHGAEEESIEIFMVPGTFEMPTLARRLASSGNYDAVICLGAVIRGSTPHFDYVAGEVSKGVAKASYDTGTPVIYGILTTDTLEQAIERAGTKAGNRGFDAALSAIEMASLFAELKSQGK